ncbi:MAG: hypothetical protein SFT92_04460 [Rickettsiales bacterium]|nr:hypothetical protein [Rickettsiales bacterium]
MFDFIQSLVCWVFSIGLILIVAIAGYRLWSNRQRKIQEEEAFEEEYYRGYKAGRNKAVGELEDYIRQLIKENNVEALKVLDEMNQKIGLVEDEDIIYALKRR